MQLQLLLLTEDRVARISIPENKRGQFILPTDDILPAGMRLSANGDGESWYLQLDNDIRITPISSKADQKGTLASNAVYFLEYADEPACYICCDEINIPGCLYTTYDITNRGEITLSGNVNGDIQYRNPLLSAFAPVHIRCREGRPYSIQLNMDSGEVDSWLEAVYINGERLKGFRLLNPGDCISLLTLRVAIGPDFLSINNPHAQVRVSLPKKTISPFKMDLEKEPESEHGSVLFSSGPRSVREFVPRQMDIKDPPTSEGVDQMPALVMVGPALTMAAGSLITQVATINNLIASGAGIGAAMPALAGTLLMGLGTAGWPMINRKLIEKRNTEKRYLDKKDYDKYLQHVEAELEEAKQEQTETLISNHPDVNTCIQYIETTSEELWQRSRQHHDFLEVSIGTGERPLDVKLNYKDQGYSTQTTQSQDDLKKLVEKPRILHDVPLTLNLKDAGIVGVVGQRNRVISFIKAMLIQLTALHNYEDLKIMFIYEEDERSEWEFVKWIPHMWNNDKTFRMLANDAEEVRTLGSMIDMLKEREEKEVSKDAHYIIFAASQELAERTAAIKSLYREEKLNGITLIAMYNEHQSLPKGTRYVINLFDQQNEGVDVQADHVQGYMSDLNDLTGKKVWIRNKIDYSASPLSMFTRMANIQLDSPGSSGKLPDRFTLTDLFQIGKVEHMDLLDRWKLSDPVQSLAAPIGIDPEGYLIELDLHEKAHGPHGAIAGMTGSGKSEFVISYIMAMALSFSPDDVAFVFIDFKGGGMADVFKDLPHTAGTITNLDGNELQRSFLAIENELAKRQKQFKKISELKRISNIDIYKYQKLRQDDKSLEPLPHLILVCDEFAELRQQQGDFMKQLIQIARIGRSLGVHLVLATQKPDGVVDPQIQSNIRFRVCLKVQEKSDSQGMIGRPDAAWLSRAGSFYLSVGNGEVFRFGQAPFSGARYEPAEKYLNDVPDFIEVLSEQGQVIARPVLAKPSLPADIPEKQVDALVEYISRTAAKADIKAKRIWLDPLPAPVQQEKSEKLFDPAVKPFILNPVIGTYDDLLNQEHLPLTIPFSESGNTLIYGMAGSGKQDLLYTMLLRIMEHHSPREVQFWLVDADAGTLAAFENVSYTQISSDLYNLENVKETLDTLGEILSERKQMFRLYGGDFASYLRADQPSQPCHLLVIHNYQNLVEADSSLQRKLLPLLREGYKYGIYTLITGMASNSLPYSMIPLFKNVYALQQNKDSEYTEIFGRTHLTPSAHKGRGLVRAGKQLCEFQTDLMFEQEVSPFTAAAAMAADYEAQWKIKDPEFARSLEESTKPEESAESEGKTGSESSGDSVTKKAGFNGVNKAPISVRSGSVRSGRTVNGANPFTRRTGSVSSKNRTKKVDVDLQALPVGRDKSEQKPYCIRIQDYAHYLMFYGPEHQNTVRRIVESIRQAGQTHTVYDCRNMPPEQLKQMTTDLKKELKIRSEAVKAWQQTEHPDGELGPKFDPFVILMENACDQLDRMELNDRKSIIYCISNLTPRSGITFVLSEAEENIIRFKNGFYFGTTLPATSGLLMSQNDQAPGLFDSVLPETDKQEIVHIHHTEPHQLLTLAG